MFQGSRFVDGVEVETLRSLVSSESLSLRRNVVLLSGQRYDMRINLLFDRRNVNSLHARLAAHLDSVGHHRTFTLPCPQPPGTGPELPVSDDAERRAADPWNASPWNAGIAFEPQPGYLQAYLATDRLVLDSQALAGATSVNLRRTSANARSIVAGRLVTFAGSTKLHRILTTATFPDTTTVRTITFTPALIANVNAATYVRLNSVATVRYQLDESLTIIHNSRVFQPPVLDVYEAF